MKRITILLTEDHTIVREGFRKMLGLEPDIEIVGEAEGGRQAVALATKLRPDVVLMDIAMPHMNGLEATRQLLKAVPTSKVLIVSAHGDDAYVKSALESGAHGFLVKQSSSQELCQAIRGIHAGKKLFSPEISKRLETFTSQTRDRGGAISKKPSNLTSREMEVLQLIAEGAPNKQIASELSISAKTVEKHRAHLMQKLNIHDTAGLTRYAIGAGIIESSVQVTIVQ